MQCPLLSDQSFNEMNNIFDMNVFKRICAEFGVSSNSDFRRKLDPSKGMGAIRYITIHTTYSHHHMSMNKEKVLETGSYYDPSRGDFTVEISSSG